MSIGPIRQSDWLESPRFEEKARSTIVMTGKTFWDLWPLIKLIAQGATDRDTSFKNWSTRYLNDYPSRIHKYHYDQDKLDRIQKVGDFEFRKYNNRRLNILPTFDSGVWGKAIAPGFLYLQMDEIANVFHNNPYLYPDDDSGLWNRRNFIVAIIMHEIGHLQGRHHPDVTPPRSWSENYHRTLPLCLGNSYLVKSGLREYQEPGSTVGESDSKIDLLGITWCKDPSLEDIEQAEEIKKQHSKPVQQTARL